MARIALLALTIALSATGCATVEGDMARAEATDLASTLRAAGFTLIPSDTPQRIESMRTLPPLAFTRVMRGGRPYFLYADPRACMCLWVGSQAQMERYRQLSGQEELSAMQDDVTNAELQAELWDPSWSGIDY